MINGNNTGSNYSVPKPQGYVNLVFTDSKGTEFKIKKGAPLFFDGAFEQYLLQQAKNDPNFTITLTGKVFAYEDKADFVPPVFDSPVDTPVE